MTRYVGYRTITGAPSEPSTTTRAAAIAYAQRFAWGFENYVGGSDDWRCGVNLNIDDNDDPMAFDDGPCNCPECDGASARAFSRKMPLSIRVALNLAKVT